VQTELKLTGNLRQDEKTGGELLGVHFKESVQHRL